RVRHVEQGLAARVTAHLRRDDLGGALGGLFAAAGQVRGRDHVGQGPQFPVGGWWFLVVDVECQRTEFAAAQQVRQWRVVEQPAACRVDQDRALGKQRELL